MVGNKPQSLLVLQIQAHKVGGNTRNSLLARTKKYWFSTAAIQEGDVGEPILTQLPKLHAQKSQYEWDVGSLCRVMLQALPE
jgi:hypothetical protein